MKLEFTPEDFSYCEVAGLDAREDVAADANAKLAAYIKEHGKVVSGLFQNGYYAQFSEVTASTYDEDYGSHGIDTHTAILINIEKIKPCEHEPVKFGRYGDEAFWYETTCKHCGIKLKPSGWVAE